MRSDSRSFLLLRLGYYSVATLVFPFVFIWAVFNKRIRPSIADRMGFGAWATLSDPVDVWIHAASLGELAGVAPVVNALKLEHPTVRVLVTTTSDTGNIHARSIGLGDEVLFLPFDHPFFVARALEIASPKAFLCFETEIWPMLFLELASRGVPLLVVNGRISEYSYPKYLRYSRLFRAVLQQVTKFLVQTEVDKDRFLSIGVDANRVLVVGSTKYDGEVDGLSAEELQEFADDLGISLMQHCFVAGSVRPGEIDQVVEAYKIVQDTIPGLQMILAPRHPEKFEESAKILETAGIAYSRRSAREVAHDTSCLDSTAPRVLLLDSLGELCRVYALSTVSFVGGTLADIGGHNPMEPAAFQVPIIVGPYIGNIQDAVVELRVHGGVLEVNDGVELGQALIEVLSSDAIRRNIGHGAYEAWKVNLGATEKVMEELRPMLEDAR